FQRLLAVNPGFEPESAVAMFVSMPAAQGPADQRRLAQFYQQLLERLGAIPGVISVGGTNALPMSGEGANGTFIIEEGANPAKDMAGLVRQLDALRGTGKTGDADFRVSSAEYFAAMGIPVVRGRFFQDSDGPDAPHVAVISQTMARRFWPNEDPIGRQIQFGNMDGD